MHELILLRHAEAMSASPDGSDGARPLSVHGENEASAAGNWLAQHGARPELVLCSPARRTADTAQRVIAALGDVPLRCASDIYEATPGELIGLLDPHRHLQQVLLIGHNPGLEQLVGLLVEGRSEEHRGLPPAGVAWITLAGPLEPGSGRMKAFWSPR